MYGFSRITLFCFALNIRRFNLRNRIPGTETRRIYPSTFLHNKWPDHPAVLFIIEMEISLGIVENFFAEIK